MSLHVGLAGHVDRVAQVIGAGQHDVDQCIATFVGLLDAIVVAVVVDEARDAADRNLAEVVVRRGFVHTHLDRGDLRWRGARRGRRATGGARHGLAIQGTRRLGRLGHRVGARRQVGEAVVAVRVGGHRDRDGGAIDGGALQLDGHAGDALLIRVDDAIVVGVHPHLAGDAAAARDLTEQVVHRGTARLAQVDVGNPARHRGHRRRGARSDTVHCACGGDAVGGTGRLGRLGQAVLARTQAVEVELAILVGGGSQAYRRAGVIDTVQLDGHTGQADFTGTSDGAVIVDIQEHRTCDRHLQHFAEVVVFGFATGHQRDAGDRTGYGIHAGCGAAGRTGLGDAVGGDRAIPGGLLSLLRHLVGAGQQIDELVLARRIGQRLGHRLARCILGTCRQFHFHIGQTRLTAVLHAVVVAVQVHHARQHRGDLTEVVFLRTGGRQVGDGDDVAGVFLTIGQAGRLLLGNGVIHARDRIRPAVVAILVGGDRHIDVVVTTRLAIRAIAGDDDLHARQAKLTAVLITVVIAVHVDGAADRRLLQFTKQVAVGLLSRIQTNATEDVGHGIGTRNGRVAGGVLAVFVTGRLGFGDGVSTFQQITEAVPAITVGGGRTRGDDVAALVGAAQGQRYTFDGLLTGILDTVVVACGRGREIFVHVTGKRPQRFTEIVAGRAVQRELRDADLVGRMLLAFGIASRLQLLDHIVHTRGQIGEGVVALCVSFHAHQLGAAIGGVKHHPHLLDTAIGSRVHRACIGCIEAAVVIAVHIDRTGNTGNQHLTEVVAFRHATGGQGDAADGTGHGLHVRCRAAGRTGRGLAIAGHSTAVRRLDQLLGHRIGAGQQIDEPVLTGGIGGRLGHDHAQCVDGACRQFHVHARQAWLAIVLRTIVVAVQVNHARQHRGDFTVVVARGTAGRQVVDGDDVRRTGIDRAVLLAIAQVGRLGFGDTVVLAGHRIRIGVVTVTVGDDGRARNLHPVARALFHLDGDAHVRDAVLASILLAVIVAVDVYGAADRCIGQLAEQVAGGLLPCTKTDAADDVGHRVAAALRGIARGVLAIDVRGRLGFSEDVLTFQQIHEQIGAIVAGLDRRIADRLVVGSRARQRHAHVADGLFMRRVVLTIVVARTGG
ncbi:hypothetical protein D3C81_547290 [compost metagenome]